MGDPLQAFSAIGRLVDGIKKAVEVAKRVQNAEIQGVLLDAQEMALSLKEELVNLRAENLALSEQLAARLSVTLDGGAYWWKTEAGRQGPFCPRCYGVLGKLILLQATYDFFHSCPECKQVFEITSAPRRPPPPPLIREIVRG
jgi:hypothetical protein